MGREIVYSEVRRGVFKPQLTRAQRRQAGEVRQSRLETIQGLAILIALAALLIGGHIIWYFEVAK